MKMFIIFVTRNKLANIWYKNHEKQTMGPKRPKPYLVISIYF